MRLNRRSLILQFPHVPSVIAKIQNDNYMLLRSILGQELGQNRDILQNENAKTLLTGFSERLLCVYCF
jgi:hypothetical protein